MWVGSALHELQGVEVKRGEEGTGRGRRKKRVGRGRGGGGECAALADNKC